MRTVTKPHMSWNLKEYRELIREKYGKDRLSRVEVYNITLDWKIKRAQYHADKVDEYWKDVLKRALRSGMHTVTSRQSNIQIMYFSAFEMEAMIQTLHSLGDVLAQMVNAALPENHRLTENKVNLKSMLSKVPENSRLSVSLQNLLSSPEYKYIAAFCNTIKHRNLVDVDYYSYRDMIKREEQQGFRFQEFSYNSVSFKATLFDEIKNNYRNDFLDKIRRVGIELNNSLKH